MKLCVLQTVSQKAKRQNKSAGKQRRVRGKNGTGIILVKFPSRPGHCLISRNRSENRKRQRVAGHLLSEKTGIGEIPNQTVRCWHWRLRCRGSNAVAGAGGNGIWDTVPMMPTSAFSSQLSGIISRCSLFRKMRKTTFTQGACMNSWRRALRQTRILAVQISQKSVMQTGSFRSGLRRFIPP